MPVDQNLNQTPSRCDDVTSSKSFEMQSFPGESESKQLEPPTVNHLPSMPQQNTTDTPLVPSRPVTCLRNASAHPGNDAKWALSNRCDPEIIEQEKFDRQVKKDAKEQQKADNAARKKATQHRIEELRASKPLGLKKRNVKFHVSNQVRERLQWMT